LFVNVAEPFVFDRVPLSVRSVEHTPLLRRKRHGVRERLENEIPILGAVSVVAQRSERKSVSGVVRQIEPALDREAGDSQAVAAASMSPVRMM
jgi:hypothetical protein